MNKQELIEELARHASCLEDFRGITGHCDGKYEAYEIAIELAQQLAEPQKPVVPKCAELWLEGHCSASDVINLFIAVTYATDSDGFVSEKWKWSGEFYDWLVEDADTLYILCDALRYGYEVEKEPLYIMPVPHVSFSVHYCVEDDHISFRQGNAQKFTQAELDRYFPDVKQFAVPVDEVEEG